MRILRDTDWNLIGIQGRDGFIFKHKLYGDLLLVRKAKFILTKENVVFFCDITAERKVCVSESTKRRLNEKSPSVKDIVNNGIQLLEYFGYSINRLTAISNL